MIVADNLIKAGRICNENTDDDRIVGLQAFYDYAGKNDRISCTCLQTVGSKGHDGMAFIKKLY